MPLGEEIDQLKRDLVAKRVALEKQLDLCDVEQGAGRTGYDALVEADRLLGQANSLAKQLKEKVDEALKRLGG